MLIGLAMRLAWREIGLTTGFVLDNTKTNRQLSVETIVDLIIFVKKN
jgi:hypothetical protein